NLLPRREPTLNLIAWPNGDDAPSGNGNSAIVNHTARAVHRDNGAAKDQEIDCPSSLGGNIR
ncbi:MAG TPA: hypothetical protein VHQ94_21700, partial [Pyrinomonadaceae bacterium]|nr:hypothetical protein [Pyrinomonadaceae bacterium]